MEEIKSIQNGLALGLGIGESDFKYEILGKTIIMAYKIGAKDRDKELLNACEGDDDCIDTLTEIISSLKTD